jgi:hypothetical protein
MVFFANVTVFGSSLCRCSCRERKFLVMYASSRTIVLDSRYCSFRFRILNGSLESARVDLEYQLHQLQQQDRWVFLVRYRDQTAYFISADNYDPEPAFEITRNGMTLGVHEHPSRTIGVFKKETVDILLKESGEDVIPNGGVSVEGVDGELICSGDGDFVISGSQRSDGRKVSRWIEDDCVRNADVLCQAGITLSSMYAYFTVLKLNQGLRVRPSWHRKIIISSLPFLSN